MLTKQERDAIRERAVGAYDKVGKVFCLDIPRLLDALEEAESREAKLVEALRYYADQRNYEESFCIGGFEEPGEYYHSWADYDRGQRARDTLKELGYGER